MNRVVSLYGSSIGKKAIMAVTGLVLFGYCVGHVLGNLQIFGGQEKIDGYAQFLHSSPGILWGTRALLIVCTVLHVLTTLQLLKMKRAARPPEMRYRSRDVLQASLASRTMIVTGPLILVFVVFHILHLTVGWKAIDPDFVELQVYDNLVRGFSNKGLAAFYVVALVVLAFHLRHGVWSMFQTLGVSHPRFNALLREFALVASLGLAILFITVPVAILIGFGHAH